MFSVKKTNVAERRVLVASAVIMQRIYAIRSNEITVTSLLKLMNIRTPEMIKCLFILYYFYIKYKTKYNKPKV